MTNIIEFKTEHRKETEQYYDLEEINNVKEHLHLLEKLQARSEKQVCKLVEKCYEDPLSWYTAKTQRRLRHIAYNLDSRVPFKSLTEVNGAHKEEWWAQKYIQEDICILPWLTPQRDKTFPESRKLVMEEAWEICTREIHPKDMFDVFLAAEKFVFYHREIIRNYEKLLLKKFFNPVMDFYENLESKIARACTMIPKKGHLNVVQGGKGLNNQEAFVNANIASQRKQ